MSSKRGPAIIKPSSAERLAVMIQELANGDGTVRELARWAIQEGLTRYPPDQRDDPAAVAAVRRALAGRMRRWRDRGIRVPYLAGESSAASTIDAVAAIFGVE